MTRPTRPDPGRKCTPTERERRFIMGLGQWARTAGNRAGTGIPRLILLKRYRDSMHKRKNWGDIDKAEIKKFWENQTKSGKKRKKDEESISSLYKKMRKA